MNKTLVEVEKELDRLNEIEREFIELCNFLSDKIINKQECSICNYCRYCKVCSKPPEPQEFEKIEELKCYGDYVTTSTRVNALIRNQHKIITHLNSKR